MIGLKLVLLGINFTLLAIMLGDGAWGAAYFGIFLSIVGVFVGSVDTSIASE
ncbi:nodulation efficiency protein NfeD [Halostagnicola sp. A-GB9-2]|uniref:nodulation efficiency protein NfeD n=1 Tax=Halostagnicola sp. A-GB9-2 TaxID=3048066 RepID=UPI0024BFCB61|nr:nodulation efficiency protein NfeD [Halostagnicola sp. A-GB9-2]MDJ1432751.1 nodulation efficiency protein NfeD [Halostagnicola sp. A-GB9-2]